MPQLITPMTARKMAAPGMMGHGKLRTFADVRIPPTTQINIPNAAAGYTHRTSLLSFSRMVMFVLGSNVTAEAL